MSTLSSRVRATAATLAVTAGALAIAAPASASGGDRGVERTGTCSAGAVWKLKAKHDDGRIDVEFEVDSNRVGQTWNVRLLDNGVVVFRGTRQTVAPSGSFSLERRIANRPGIDTIRAVATHAPTGQRCVGRVRL